MGKKSKLTFIDLFAGCGGLSEGFLQTNQFEALAHVEWELPMVSTLRKRLQEKWHHSEEESIRRVIHFDIQQTNELINGKWSKESVRKYSATNHLAVVEAGLKGVVGKKKVDLIIGGPPCQAYSIAGRAQDKNSMKNDYRNYLFESFVKVVDEFRPSVFVFENVPGLLSATPGNKPVTERIFEAFHKIGYKIRTPELMRKAVYSASDLGVPQKRNRVIIIGTNFSSKVDIESLYNELDCLRGNVTPKTVRDAIGYLPKLIPLKSSQKTNGRNVSHTISSEKKIKYHDPRFHNSRDIKTFNKWVTEQMNNRSSLEKIAFYNGLVGKKSNHAKYRNLEWDKPSPTIVAHLSKDGLMFIHPDPTQARSITLKEAALLQSFPDDYEFLGSTGVCYKMVGNAVPPKMAKEIAKIISKIFLKK